MAPDRTAASNPDPVNGSTNESASPIGYTELACSNRWPYCSGPVEIHGMTRRKGLSRSAKARQCSVIESYSKLKDDRKLSGASPQTLVFAPSMDVTPT